MKDETFLAKWLNNELEGAELETFKASPEYAAYDKIKEYSAQLSVPEADMDALYERINSNKNKPKVKKLNPWLPRVAAMLVMALGAFYFFYTNNTTTQLAAAGERKEFLLPDNSEVTLNAGSEADYKTWNWKNNRKLQLNGEAYFKVAKGQTFDVETTMGKVTVVGTQFNVKARGSRFDITCFEGKVKVTSNTTTILLTPGESIAFEDGKLLELPTDSSNKPGWLTYEVFFHKEKFANVISELERQYNVEIIVNTPQQEDGFNGPIPMNNINDALEIIKTTYHLKSQKQGNKIILSVE